MQKVSSNACARVLFALVVDGEKPIGAPSFRGADGDIQLSVIFRHLHNLNVLVKWTVLSDAEVIDPDSSKTQAFGQDDGVAKSLRMPADLEARYVLL